MSADADRLFALLPAVYRTRDSEVTDHGPLRALLAIVAEQLEGLEENVEQLYDDLFIETCADWVVPYIADLIGYRALDPQLQGRLGSTRSEVANTIAFRRRKGTAAVLEELALDITGWDAAAVEFFLRLATTQYLAHIRLDHHGTPDLRDVDALEAIGGAFDRVAHTADVRRIASRGGRYNIPNVGIFLWRLGARKITDAPAFRVDDRRYRFDALGGDLQLYNAAERSTDVTRLAGPLDVPLPITRRGLRRALDDLYGPGRSLTVAVDGDVLGVDEVEACDLRDSDSGGWGHSGQSKAAIDPVLGRVMLATATDRPVTVTYHTAFGADIGGGEYDRSATSETPPAPVRPVGPGGAVDAALTALGGAGTVELSGSGTHAAPAALTAAAGARLALRAANGARPVLQPAGDIVITGGDSGEVELDGLLIAGGRLLVPAQAANRLQRLRITHCTLVPRAGAVSVQVDAPNVILEIDRSIVGALRVDDGSEVVLSNSVVDAGAPDAVAYADRDGASAGGPVEIDACTLIGKVHAAQLTASDAIFHAALGAGDTWAGPVLAQRRQTGYVRYSAVPPGAQLPPRYHCPPDAARSVPRFTSLRYGDPAYAQLHAACPCEIRRGAADEGEMGVYHDVFAPQRLAGLGVRLDEYLRFGLEAGVILAS